MDQSEIARQLQDWIDKMEMNGQQITTNDINNHLDVMMRTRNAAPKLNFNGFSSEQMFRMLYQPLEAGCPVQLRRLTEEQIVRIPVMRQVLHLMDILNGTELKLTAQGYIPPKIVAELYETGSHSWRTDWYKQKSEPKTEEIQVLRVVLKECGLIKTRTGKMSLTATGKQLLSDHNELVKTVLLFLLKDYNTGWLDLYDDMESGNVGRLYSLWLLHHYGGEWRNTQFYADEYRKAFPTLGDERPYEYRVFNRLFRFIGVCEINESDEFVGRNRGEETRKTDILEMMFAFEEPQ